MPDNLLFGKYEVTDEIARGGMGVLYRALDKTLNRHVAIKVLHTHLSGDAGFAERFLREARAMARLDHDHIVRIYAVEAQAGAHFLVMEYFPGMNLRQVTLDHKGPLPLRRVLDIILQLSDALAYAHAQGIIHRDIKPANVLINPEGKTKLTDFGIAAAKDELALTSPGQILGTPEYMAPEQARWEHMDARTDLYSLGIVLYELLTGHTPYHDVPKTAVLFQLFQAQEELTLALPRHIPSSLRAILEDLVRRRAEERTPNATTLSSQLQSVLDALPSTDEAWNTPLFPTSDRTQTMAKSTIPWSPEYAKTMAAPAPQLSVGPAADAPTAILPQPPTELATSGSPSSPPLPSSTPASPHRPPSPTAPKKRKDPSTIAVMAGGTVTVLVLLGGLWWVLSGNDPRPPRHADNITPQEGIASPIENGGDGGGTGGSRNPSHQPITLAHTQNQGQQAAQQERLTRRAADRSRLEAEQPRLADAEATRQRERVAANQEAPPPVVASVPKPGADPMIQLKAILSRFKSAYEEKDVAALEQLSRMDGSRTNLLRMMFQRYSSITVSINQITQVSDQEATAVVLINQLVDQDGNRVTVSPILRVTKLQIPRKGSGWGKIMWK